MITQERLKELEAIIQAAYESELTMADAEKHAAQFLQAQMQVSYSLSSLDLEARMRKSGLKAIKAAVYATTISASEKKPTESSLEHTLNADTTVLQTQEDLDRAEVKRDELERYYNIFREAHVFFRTVARGTFGG